MQIHFRARGLEFFRSGPVLSGRIIGSCSMLEIALEAMSESPTHTMLAALAGLPQLRVLWIELVVFGRKGDIDLVCAKSRLPQVGDGIAHALCLFKESY
jgi:hypothetical protein